MKKYWKSPEELKFGPDLKQEPKTEMDHRNAVIDLLQNSNSENGTTRRDFLKVWGYSLTAATIVASCERPVQKTIPYLIKPEEVIPGEASHYASSFFNGSEYASILVKTRDGRPIKIEGNDLSPFSKGKASATVQASVLSLYDDARYRGPEKNSKPLSWEEMDAEVILKLEEITNRGGKIVLLTGTIISPSTSETIALFQKKYPSVQWIQYDPVSFSGMLHANEKAFGKKVIPDYRFGKAGCIVSFGADFLGTWLAPVYFTRGYSKRRKLLDGSKEMSRHIHFESGMSVTGSNADHRFPINPAEEHTILANLYNQLAGNAGVPAINTGTPAAVIDDIARELLKHKSTSLVVSGSNDENIQLLVNKINLILENYGTTIDLDNHLNLRKGSDPEMKIFLEELNSGKIDGVIFYNTDPLYNLPESGRFLSGLEKCGFTLSMNTAPDETSTKAGYSCPDNHYLESWNDAEFRTGSFSLAQPAIHPLFNTRQAQDSLLTWAGFEGNYYDFIKTFWESNIYNKQKDAGTFEKFWMKALQDGVHNPGSKNRKTTPEWLAGMFFNKPDSDSGTGLRMCFYEKISVRDGQGANNPWLQEMPDPISKACWDNYLCISPQLAENEKLENEDVVRVNGMELPVFVQPGQAEGTVSVALGYGRTNSGRVASGTGVNIFPAVSWDGDNRQYWRDGVVLEKTGRKYKLALTQTHHSMEGRPIVKETTLEEYLHTPEEGHEEGKREYKTLYKDVKFDGHHWGLAINLNACTACGACILACQAENNIPVVGKEEVRKRRILHWIRIDRYYADEPENPSVVHQPVMCMHCDNAPCENVCPVSATMHSNEGLNQVAYNRCIGTKYCINNCPYRVRRFNWFKYAGNDKFDYQQNSDLGRLVLNPDVVVRGRGVVEKCSFCVQRIQDKKLKAKLENRTLEDGEIQTACTQTCPSEALVFGDLNDPESKVSRMFENNRNYFLLEELHILPSVGYLKKVRNSGKNAGGPTSHV